ncbi:hypothetical protein C8F01DRAFT_1149292 [Mycena amicta]|nr:hypothetical protein C8F01DRAFT_1149292 [Mycena amicta]
MESSTQVDATFFSSGTDALSTFQNNSRIALRRLFQAGPQAKHHDTVHENSDDASHWSESESESSEEAPSPPPVSRVIPHSIYYWNHPRRKLLDLPPEIIEHIAVSLREPRCLRLVDMAALYISDRYSDFSDARFHLSALNKTCWQLRLATQRILYRNIQLDVTGWKGRKHTAWPAASLRLLLRTLDERPDLARYIHVAALDFPLSANSIEIEQALEKFLVVTPSLKFFCLAQCPLAFWDHKIDRLKGFATSFAPGILPSVLEDLASLEELHLRDSHVMALSGTLPRHKIQRVRMDSSHADASAYFARVLSIFGAILKDLDVRYIGGLQQPSPLFLHDGTAAAYPHRGGQNLRSLRLDNISVLTHVSSAYAHILRGLPVLETLHVTHHKPFAPSAFHMLPASLDTLTASHYYGLWASEKIKDGFLSAFATCVEMSPREILRVEGASRAKQEEPSQGVVMKRKEREAREKKEKEADERLDIKPVADVCRTEGIRCDEVKDAAGPFIRVFFGKRPTGPEWTVKIPEPPEEDDESGSEDEEA